MNLSFFHQASMRGEETLPSTVVETEALQAVRKLLNVDKEAYRPFGAEPPRTLLLSGPPGVGKTKAVRIASQEMSIPLFSVTPGPQIFHSLKTAFKSAKSTAFRDKMQKSLFACIVFIDEIDAVCPATNTSSLTSTMNAATSLLLSFIDSEPKAFAESINESMSTVLVIAATNRPNEMHPSLRRAGRFDRETVLRPPSISERYDLLFALEPKISEDILLDVAEHAIGFVAADLVALCRTAHGLENGPGNTKNDGQEDRHALHRRFKLALRRTAPSALRSAIAAEVPITSWNDIGGLKNVKKRLKMAVEWPLLHSGTFKRLGLKAPRGILLHGPPGCSKTTLVRAAASQGHASFIRLNGADIYSCYLGEAERILREAFALARTTAPCVLFLDEIDAIVGKRSIQGSQTDGNGVQERVLSTLLTEMDGVVSAAGVLVIGATNRVDLLDDALLRPGRFDDILKVGMPDEEARLEILQIHTAQLPLGEDVDLPKLAEQTAGKSGAELMSVCVEAGLAALRETYVSTGAIYPDATHDDATLLVMSRHFGTL